MSASHSLVSLNGPDNVGKTTHLRWLHRTLAETVHAGTIDQYNSRWREIAADGFSKWWFESSSTVEHTGLILDSHVARVRSTATRLALLDRGLPMLIATCAATAALKDQIPVDEALGQATEMAVSQLPIDVLGRPSIDILMVPSLEPAEALEAGLSRECSFVSERYRSYQALLIKALQLQISAGAYHEVVVTGSSSVLDVQNHVRRVVSARLNRPIAELLNEVDTVWALGGLSESGKSTVGQFLGRTHEVRRLKIGYLLDNVRYRLAITEDELYLLPAVLLAEEMVVELARYAAAHKDIRAYSIESLHRVEFTRHLKEILGDRLVIVFVDAPFQVRLTRSGSLEADVTHKDAVKTSRGALQVRNHADETIDNTGNFTALRASVARLVARRLPSSTPEVARISDLQLPGNIGAWLEVNVAAAIHFYGPALRLIAITGSGSTPDWLPNWSDLDMLLVTTGDAGASVLGDFANAFRTTPPNTPVSWTVLTEGEVASLALPPRLVHAFRLIGTGKKPVLYIANGYQIPTISLVEDVTASSGEIRIVVATLRRLLLSLPRRPQALYKHVLLLAKLLLRASGIHEESQDRLIEEFNARYPQSSLKLPSALNLRNAPPGGSEHAATVAAALAILYFYELHFTHPPFTAETGPN